MIPTNKTLFAIVVGMGVVLFMGFGALIMGLVMKTDDLTTTTGLSTLKPFELNSSLLTKIKIPTGFRIKNVTTNSTQITMHIENKRGREEIVIFEIISGKLLGRYLIEENQ